jgi:hypothetical protein
MSKTVKANMGLNSQKTLQNPEFFILCFNIATRNEMFSTSSILQKRISHNTNLKQYMIWKGKGRKDRRKDKMGQT